jgi:hypothetical protein
VLCSRLRAVEDDFARLEKGCGAGKATDRLEENIKTFKLQMVDREVGERVASEINYLDLRWVALLRIPRSCSF